MDRSRWQFSLHGLLLFTLSVAIGLSFWRTEHAFYVRALKESQATNVWPRPHVERHDWYLGLMATVSFWIVLGLGTQTRDIWRRCRGNAFTSDERWGWRFAVSWRVAVCGVIGGYFLLRLLVAGRIMPLSNFADVQFSALDVYDAVLLTSIIIAVAGSPRFAQMRVQGSGAWALDVLGGIAVAGLFTLVLLDRMAVPALTHITVTIVQMSWPLEYSASAISAASPDRAARFFSLATAGVALTLLSCILLRSLAARWHNTGWRLCIIVLLAGNLTILVLLAGRVAFVEFPGLSPVMAANVQGTPLLLAAGALLTTMLAATVARRWSEPLPDRLSGGVASCSSRETRYHHERVFLTLLLGVTSLAECVGRGLDLSRSRLMPFRFRDIVWYIVESPVGCLSLALILLATQGMWRTLRKHAISMPNDRARLRPGLFMVTWSSLAIITICGAQILAAWGFLLWLRIGWPYR